MCTDSYTFLKGDGEDSRQTWGASTGSRFLLLIEILEKKKGGRSMLIKENLEIEGRFFFFLMSLNNSVTQI